MPECLTQLVQFIFSAFSIISGVVSSLPLLFCGLFLFSSIFFFSPDSKNKDFKALVWDFSAHHIDECKGVFLNILSMAHVKTAVSTLGPLYSLYSRPSGRIQRSFVHSVLTSHLVCWSYIQTNCPPNVSLPLPSNQSVH